jgi:hypothetical protein
LFYEIEDLAVAEKNAMPYVTEFVLLLASSMNVRSVCAHPAKPVASWRHASHDLVPESGVIQLKSKI